MDRQAVIEGVKRLAAQNPSATDRMQRGEQEAYITEIESHFAWLKAVEWSRVVDWMISNRRTRSLPLIPEIRDAVAAIRGSGGIAAPEECRGCRGTHFGIVLLRNLETGEVGEFARTCPVCRPQVGFMPKQGWEIVSSADDPLVRQAKAMSPAAARRALSYLDDRNGKVREDVMLALVERASQEPTPGEPPIRKLSAILNSALPEAFDPAKYRGTGT